MTRMIRLFTALALILTLLVPAFAAEAETPVIAMTYCPVYGESGYFEGFVYNVSGEPVDYSQYRITLYVQLESGGQYWVKPTWAKPYADINPDGSFSIAYGSGGNDILATEVRVLLIPSTYTPDSSYHSYSNCGSVKLDDIKIVRTSEGVNTVTPARTAPDSMIAANSRPSGITVSANTVLLDVGFYTTGNPNYESTSEITEEMITSQLLAIRPYCDTIRLYNSASGGIGKAYQIAHDMGFQVIGSAWLDQYTVYDENGSTAEMDALIDLCNSGLCCAAVVGSETLLRGNLTIAQLVEKINYVRDRITDKSIPVTTADSIGEFLEENSIMLRNACDFLYVNSYPYWSKSSIDTAGDDFIASIEKLQKHCSGKEILVSETGWPTAGNGKVDSTTYTDTGTEADSVTYFNAVSSWSVSSGVPVFWFASADEPWKASAEGTCGAHWGLFTSELEIKSAFAKLPLFQTTAALKNAVSAADGKFFVTAANDGKAKILLIAAYSDSGRFISLQKETISADYSGCYFESLNPGNYKIFMLSEGFLPLCGSAAVKVPQTS